jgi:CMP/dCMP kinase
MIVTIDGPAGAGKSSVARMLAVRLGFRFLDTGAMYRVVTLAATRKGLDWADSAGLALLARALEVDLNEDRVLLNGEDVTMAIRTWEITANTCHVAGNRAVRKHLVALQRQIAEGGNIVTEGRDQATEVFPAAECKIFLTASHRERAERRWQELLARGDQVTLEEVLEQQLARDERDSNREVGRLAMAADSVEFSTDGLSLEQVVDRLEQLVRARMGS